MTWELTWKEIRSVGIVSYVCWITVRLPQPTAVRAGTCLYTYTMYVTRASQIQITYHHIIGA